MSIRQVYVATCDTYGRHRPPVTRQVTANTMAEVYDHLKRVGWSVMAGTGTRPTVVLCPECATELDTATAE